MKFGLYYVDIGLYEITINDMVCATSNTSIKDLIKELQDLVEELEKDIRK